MVMSVSRNLRKWTVALAAATLAPIPTYAHEAPPGFPAARWDVAIELPSWPALQDLQPAGGGSFDSVGFGIGGAWHVPVKTFDNSELLLGTEISIAATGSDIAGFYEDLLARQFLVGLSAKWLLGSARNFSLDGGIGYYEVDIAEVDTSWWGTLEYEYWSASTGGAFVGATWDVGAGRAGHGGGLSLGLRAHFIDLGGVDGEGPLDGPMYTLRIAYSGR
jgi:hypothetical protein